jgi:hypothetical protein
LLWRRYGVNQLNGNRCNGLACLNHRQQVNQKFCKNRFLAVLIAKNIHDLEKLLFQTIETSLRGVLNDL